MHATLELAQSIDRVLPYHELKVRRGQAELIGGDNFIKEANELSYEEKLFYFKRLSSLNEAVEKPVLHVFLGFHRLDQVSPEKAQRISKDYIEGMGYQHQPWLGYLHKDTMHDHIHLVVARVQPNGKRMPVWLADLKRSRELTHQLEQKHGLDQGDEEAVLRAEHAYLQKVEYGKTSLYPAMKLVLETIVPNYRYTSLDELNAVLGLFGVRGSRGAPGSRTYQHRGLIYYPILPDGWDGPAYIKASAFPSRPTLNHLEQRFAENQSAREEHRRRLTSTIDYTLAGSELSFAAFQQAMSMEKINVVVSKEGGAGQRIWYVDHESRCVFEGAALGARYGAAAVQERCLPEEEYRQKQTLEAQEEAERQQHRMRHRL